MMGGRGKPHGMQFDTDARLDNFHSIINMISYFKYVWSCAPPCVTEKNANDILCLLTDPKCWSNRGTEAT